MPSAAKKLQTQIKPFFSVSPHPAADPISSACTRSHAAQRSSKGRPHSAGRNPTPPPSRSGVTDTGRGVQEEEGGEEGRRENTQAAFKSRDKDQLMRDRTGRGDAGGNIYHSSEECMLDGGEEGSFILRCSMYREENGEEDGNGQSINS